MAGDSTIIIDTLQNKEKHEGFPPIVYEPKRKDRFFVDFPNMFNIPAFFVQKITRPKLRFVNGNYQWDNIEIDFIDCIGLSIPQSLLKISTFCEEMKEFRQKNQPIFSFLIEDLDPTGVKIGRWIIDVDELLLVDFGEYDYDKNDIQMCKLTLKPLRCRVR